MSRSPSAWCVDHPVATLLLTFALVLLGLIAFPRLAIAPLPEAEFPTIQVTATLPGASPDTMASSVATPLEVQFSAIPGMTQMTSSSALGSSLLTLQFTLTKSIDTAGSISRLLKIRPPPSSSTAQRLSLLVTSPNCQVNTHEYQATDVH